MMMMVLSLVWGWRMVKVIHSITAWWRWWRWRWWWWWWWWWWWRWWCWQQWVCVRSAGPGKLVGACALDYLTSSALYPKFFYEDQLKAFIKRYDVFFVFKRFLISLQNTLISENLEGLQIWFQDNEILSSTNYCHNLHQPLQFFYFIGQLFIALHCVVLSLIGSDLCTPVWNIFSQYFSAFISHRKHMWHFEVLCTVLRNGNMFD